MTWIGLWLGPSAPSLMGGGEGGGGCSACLSQCYTRGTSRRCHECGTSCAPWCRRGRWAVVMVCQGLCCCLVSQTSRRMPRVWYNLCPPMLHRVLCVCWGLPRVGLWLVPCAPARRGGGGWGHCPPSTAPCPVGMAACGPFVAHRV